MKKPRFSGAFSILIKKTYLNLTLIYLPSFITSLPANKKAPVP